MGVPQCLSRHGVCFGSIQEYAHRSIRKSAQCRHSQDDRWRRQFSISNSRSGLATRSLIRYIERVAQAPPRHLQAGGRGKEHIAQIPTPNSSVSGVFILLTQVSPLLPPNLRTKSASWHDAPCHGPVGNTIAHTRTASSVSMMPYGSAMPNSRTRDARLQKEKTY